MGENVVAYTIEARVAESIRNMQAVQQELVKMSQAGQNAGTNKGAEQMKKNFDEVLSKTKSVTGQLALMGGVGAVAIGGMVKQGTAYADTVKHIAAMTGLSIAEVQQLKYTAEQNETSFDTLMGSTSRLARNMSEAKEGNVDLGTAFRSMGIDVRDSNGNMKSTLQVLMEMADFMSTSGISNTEKQALAVKVLGRSGAELLPLLKMGSKEIKAFMQDAMKQGVVETDQQIERIDRLGDRVQVFRDKMRTSFAGMLTAMAPALTAGMSLVTGLFNGFNGLPEPMKAVVANMFLLATGALVAVGSIGHLGVNITTLIKDIIELTVKIGALRAAQAAAGVAGAAGGVAAGGAGAAGGIAGGLGNMVGGSALMRMMPMLGIGAAAAGLTIGAFKFAEWRANVNSNLAENKAAYLGQLRDAYGAGALSREQIFGLAHGAESANLRTFTRENVTSWLDQLKISRQFAAPGHAAQGRGGGRERVELVVTSAEDLNYEIANAAYLPS